MACSLIFLFVSPLSAQTDGDTLNTGKSRRDRPRVETPTTNPDTAVTAARDTVEERIPSVLEMPTAPQPEAKEKSKRKQRLDGLLPPDPNVALRRSLFLPGWGQLYNRSAWKVPIVYAGFGAIGYLIVDNNRLYQQNRQAVLCLVDTTEAACPGGSVANLDGSFTGLSVDNVISVRDFYRRNRDLTIVVGCLWYGLQALDAYIEAHLQPFDVSDDLALKIKPTLDVRSFNNPSPILGASFSLQIR